MKRFVMPMLMMLDAALVVVLLALWFDTGRQLRNATWQRPAAVKPDFAAMLSPMARQEGDNVGQFVATLDRPLFSPNRRPPPVVAKADAPPPDPLADVGLYGVYSGAEGGGIIARVDGKMRRAAVNDKIGEWTITRVADRDVTFVRGGETRVVSLVRGKPSGSAVAPAAPVSQRTPASPSPGE